MKKIFVTGGAGFIGSHVCQLLTKKGFKTFCFDNLSRGNKSFVKWGEFIKGDLQNFKEIENSLCKIEPDCVIHLASYADIGESNEKPDMYYTNNIFSTINLINAMSKHKITKLIFSSSCSVFGNTKKKKISENHEKNPVSPYAVSKFFCEKIIHDCANKNKINYLILRYFNAAGCDPESNIGEDPLKSNRIIPRIISTYLKKKRNLFINGNNFKTKDGTCVRDYVHVKDVAYAHYQGLKFLKSNKQNECINIGSGVGSSIFDIINESKKFFKNDINLKFVKKRFGDADTLVSSINKARKVLDWKPKNSSLKKIINDTIVWQKKQ